jgi:hypothetical protein
MKRLVAVIVVAAAFCHATQGRLLRRLRGRAATSPHLLATLGRAHARRNATWVGSEAPLFAEPRLLRPGVGTCPPLRTNVDSPCLLEVREPVNRADMHQPLWPRLLAGAAAWFSVVLTRSAQPRVAREAAGVAAERGGHVGAASWRKATHQAPSILPCAGDRLAAFLEARLRPRPRVSLCASALTLIRPGADLPALV